MRLMEPLCLEILNNPPATPWDYNMFDKTLFLSAVILFKTEDVSKKGHFTGFFLCIVTSLFFLFSLFK